MVDEEITARWPGNCFACSSPSGLGLRFHRTESGAATLCVVPQHYCGFDGLVHGGIIATILDETSCWALFAALGRLGVTREMTTRFLRPVPVGVELLVAGRVRQHDLRGALVSCTMCDAHGELLAEGESAWAFPRISRIATLAGVHESELEQFLHQCCPVPPMP